MADTPAAMPHPAIGSTSAQWHPFLAGVLKPAPTNVEGGGGAASDRPATGQLWPRRA